MQRRQFFRTGLAAALCGGSALVGQRSASGQEADTAPDADTMAEAARRLFLVEHRTCSEAMLLLGGKSAGVESAVLSSIGLGLSSGLGRQGHTCGVVLGAAALAGLVVGKREQQPSRRKRAVLAAVARICKEFRRRHGSTDCRTLTGLDLTTLDGRAKHKAGVRRERCSQLVETGARLVAEMLRGT